MRIAARLWGHPEHGARGRSGAGPRHRGVLGRRRGHHHRGFHEARGIRSWARDAPGPSHPCQERIFLQRGKLSFRQHLKSGHHEPLVDQARGIQPVDASGARWDAHLAFQLCVRRMLCRACPRIHARGVRSVHHARRGPRLPLQSSAARSRCLVRQPVVGAPSSPCGRTARPALYAGRVPLVL